MSKNKYLEKVAESYAMAPHPDDKSWYGVDKLHLNREEFAKLENAEGIHPVQTAAWALGGATLGGTAGHFYTKATMLPYLASTAANAHLDPSIATHASRLTNIGKSRLFKNKFLGAVLGLGLGARIANTKDYNRRLENAGFSRVHSEDEND
jgi:hypothetical protein